MCPAERLGLLLTVGWIALAVALVLGVLAFLAIVTRPGWAAVEGPVGRFVGRHVRARQGIAIDAPRWACRSCHSVNEAMAEACCRCGAPAPEVAEPVSDPGADDIWSPPGPVNRFDPSRYRGPGAPATGLAAPDERDAAASDDPAPGVDPPRLQSGP